MIGKIRRPSPAMIVACLALTIALSGASYAAVTLPRNSVGARQLKRNAVIAPKIRNGAVSGPKIAANAVSAPKIAANAVSSPKVADASLLAGDFADDQLTPRAYARVQADGTLLPVISPPYTGAAQVKGIAPENITHPAPGTYCIFNLGFTPRTAMVVSDNAGASAPTQNNVIASVAIDRGNNLNGCVTTPPAQARILTTVVGDAVVTAHADHGFTIWLYG